MQMQSLAQEMGVVLFRRRGHKVETTEAGALLYQQAKDMLRGWQQTIHQLEGLRQRLQGRMELGASSVPGDFFLPPVLCEFYRLHPDLELRMTVGSSREVVENLSTEGLDLAVVGYKPESEGLISQLLFRDQLIAVFSPEHTLARRKIINLDDLVTQPLLQRSDGSATRDAFEQSLVRAGASPSQSKIIMELGSSRALLEAAAQGIGIAVVSKLSAVDYIQQGRLLSRSISGFDGERNFWLVQKDKPHSPVVKAFIEFLQRGDYLDR
jgi:DNA-binding transcriptional LysR family regulator